MLGAVVCNGGHCRIFAQHDLRINGLDEAICTPFRRVRSP